MKNFKYPTINTFFDADSVPCVFVSEVMDAFPMIDQLTINYVIGRGVSVQGGRTFESFTWNIGDVVVMAISDLAYFVRVYNETLKRCEDEGITIDEIALDMVCTCSVCETLLFPDDEVYNDKNTNESLCDSHSIQLDDGSCIKSEN